MYTNYQGGINANQVPASAHIPTMYTAIVIVVGVGLVPASAHIPTMYTTGQGSGRGTGRSGQRSYPDDVYWMA